MESLKHPGAPGCPPGGHPKKFGGDPKGPSQFEEELAQLGELEEMEEELGMGEGQPPDPQSQPSGSLFVGEVPPKWRRPSPPAHPPKSLTFLQRDIDHYVGVPPPGFPGWPHPSPILRMFGVTGEGQSICVHLHGFSPYFYVLAPPGVTLTHLEQLELELEGAEGREPNGTSQKRPGAAAAAQTEYFGVPGPFSVPFHARGAVPAALGGAGAAAPGAGAALGGAGGAAGAALRGQHRL